jgi:hypothetical protein
MPHKLGAALIGLRKSVLSYGAEPNDITLHIRDEHNILRLAIIEEYHGSMYVSPQEKLTMLMGFHITWVDKDGQPIT